MLHASSAQEALQAKAQAAEKRLAELKAKETEAATGLQTAGREAASNHVEAQARLSEAAEERMKAMEKEMEA